MAYLYAIRRATCDLSTYKSDAAIHRVPFYGDTHTETGIDLHGVMTLSGPIKL